ncbi:MAG: NAD(P)-dependent oxidoreductase [Bacteroidota bacterium]|nr:NAD(P)-dependent oxidoreductase [Bacteroidota bacterium]
MTFQKITIIDTCGLTSPVLNQITQLSNVPMVIHNDDPADDAEILRRIADSDCILVSWRTKVNAKVIQASPKLKYIGMCCSLYDEKAANVDIEQARKQGIVVKGVRDYGDDGTLEFIFAELIYLMKGLGNLRWQTANRELRGKTMGIIGMGTLGTMVARAARHFGMNVFYFNRSRKYHLEEEGFAFLPLNELMDKCDVISTHLPKNSNILGEAEFRNKKPNSILVNTSIGLTFDKDAFVNWVKSDPASYAIFDSVGVGDHSEEFSNYPNVIISDRSSGFTLEAQTRLSEKVLENMQSFF